MPREKFPCALCGKPNASHQFYSYGICHDPCWISGAGPKYVDDQNKRLQEQVNRDFDDMIKFFSQAQKQAKEIDKQEPAPKVELP